MDIWITRLWWLKYFDVILVILGVWHDTGSSSVQLCIGYMAQVLVLLSVLLLLRHWTPHYHSDSMWSLVFQVNCSTAFIWKLCCHWIKGLCQHHMWVTVTILVSQWQHSFQLKAVLPLAYKTCSRSGSCVAIGLKNCDISGSCAAFGLKDLWQYHLMTVSRHCSDASIEACIASSMTVSMTVTASPCDSVTSL